MLGVLNARGHRRGSHKLFLGVLKLRLRCSTPEGIEGGRTHRPLTTLDQDGVLNARGHRRGSHTTGHGWNTPTRPVLNARGHRRGSHKHANDTDAFGAQCSTPEGIEGGRTVFQLRAIAIAFRVLNARGHRRGSHDVTGDVASDLQTCSTPEGIEGGRTTSRRRNTTSTRCAQRPRASKGVARLSVAYPVAPVFVLNARGHRRGSHTKPPVLGK